MNKPLLHYPALRRALAPLLVALAFLLAWQIGFSQANVPVYLAPKPSDIALTLYDQRDACRHLHRLSLRAEPGD